MKEFNMNTGTFRKLALYAALALTPALVAAQGTTGTTTQPATGGATAPAAGTTAPPATTPDPAKKSPDTQSDAAYQKELAACDKQPATEREACRSKADQKFDKKSMSPGSTSSGAPSSDSTSSGAKPPAKPTY
jgi:hypothetical protein